MTNKLWDIRRKALQNILKQARTDACITQQELAALLDRPQSYVSKYESGERRLDFIEVLDICDALEVAPGKVILAYRQSLESRRYGMTGFYTYPQQEGLRSGYVVHEPEPDSFAASEKSGSDDD